MQTLYVITQVGSVLCALVMGVAGVTCFVIARNNVQKNSKMALLAIPGTILLLTAPVFFAAPIYINFF